MGSFYKIAASLQLPAASIRRTGRVFKDRRPITGGQVSLYWPGVRDFVEKGVVF